MIYLLPIHQIIIIPKMMSKLTSDNKNDYGEKPRHKHVKSVNVSHDLHSNSEIDNDRTYCELNIIFTMMT